MGRDAARGGHGDGNNKGRYNISDHDYQRLLAKVATLGYDTSKVIRVPQEWPSKG